MKAIIAAVCIGTLASNSSAECRRPLLEPLFIASTVAQVADYSTTLSTARSNGRYRESAPLTRAIIGELPSTGNVQRYFIGRLIVSAAVQCWAPAPYNRIVLWTQVIAHGAAATHNYNIGLRFQW